MEADLLFPWTTQEFVVRFHFFVPGCSIGIHRYSFPPPRKVHSESHEQSLFFFVMVMQCKRSEIRLFLMMKRGFFMLCEMNL